MLRRRGTSLGELLVALALGSIVLATATSSMLRQQRTALSVDAQVRDRAQLRPALSLLHAQLSLSDGATGDLVAGEASDTALQFRAVVAAGLACAPELGAVTLPLDDDGEMTRAGVQSLPRAGDTLWWYDVRASRWQGRALTSVTARRSPCNGANPPASGGTTLRMRLSDPDSIPALAPVRITRPLRYAFYRSSDGSWQLGLREWSEALRQLSAPQPVAGPFARAQSSGVRSGFRYFDTRGLELHPDLDAGTGARVARVRLVALSLPRAGANAGADSVDVVLRGAVP